MKNIVFNDNNNVVELEVYDTGEHVNVESYGFSWPYRKYNYKIKSIKDANGNFLPLTTPISNKNFMSFCEYDLAIFTNDDKEVFDRSEFSEFSQALINFYTKFLWYHGFRFPNLNSARVGNTLLNVDWHISNSNTYSICNSEGNPCKNFLSKDNSNKFANLTINWESDSSKFYHLNEVLYDLYSSEISQYVFDIAENMGIGDLIASISIRDPDERNWMKYNSPNGPETAISAGVFGTSYRTTWKTNMYHSKNNTREKSALVFSPLILFMNREEAKSLIVHELTHVKLGAQHCHDSYFWWVYEKYSGQSREKDISYSKRVEQEDNNYYNSVYGYYGKTVEKIIEEEKSHEYVYKKIK